MVNQRRSGIFFRFLESEKIGDRELIQTGEEVSATYLPALPKSHKGTLWEGG
jgi:hypothetical protein